MQAIDRGFAVSAAVSAVTAVALAGWYMQDCRPAVAVVLGLVLAAVTQCLTQYFTDARHRPVREVAESTRTDHHPVRVLPGPGADGVGDPRRRRGDHPAGVP
ncbi:sodium/proton-translocating pyrophosphatase [Georgenia yuyongxinii]